MSGEAVLWKISLTVLSETAEQLFHSTTFFFQHRANKIQINYKNTYKQTIFDDIPINNHLHLYRILQELINNSIRHGNARKIDIQFSVEDGKRICEYTDDGKGYDIKDTKNQRGLGIKNIESRTSLLKGDLKIESAINRGVRVILNF